MASQVGGDLRLCEMDLLGRLGAVVAPVNGSADVRLKLAQQRARSLKGEEPSVGLQEAYCQSVTAASSAKADLERKEQRLADVLDQVDDGEQASSHAVKPEHRALVAQQAIEVRRARWNFLDAEDSRNLGELALQYANLQGEAKTTNGQQSVLSAVRASHLARTRNIEDGARAMEQVRRAKLEIAAEREREKQREIEREKQKEIERANLSRPSSSPALGALPTLRLPQSSTGLQQTFFLGKPSSAPARVTSQVEAEKLHRERWIQHVRETLRIQKKGTARSTPSRGTSAHSMAGHA